jgi:hypothetical protein
MRLIDLINMFPDKPWNWKSLSRNPNITMKDVINHPDKPWNWKILSEKKILL